MNIYDITLSVLWSIAIGGVAWYCATISQQITYVTLADGRRQERKLPMLFRILLPLAPNLAFLFERRMFLKTREKMERQIISSGFGDLISASEILSLQIIMPLTLGTPWILFILGAVSANPESILGKMAGTLYVLGPVLMSLAPLSWLSKTVKTRQKSIQRSLPFVLDILTLSVEAGMDFMTALQRNVERSKIDPLTEELVQVVRTIQLGKTRKEALRDMAYRVNVSEIKSVVNALIQADELGVSIGSILRIQSDQIRQRRFERAEKLANEAPVKMLGPLLLFIFPAVFLVLLGPMIYKTIQNGF